MESPEETYRTAICQALGAHLARVEAARRTRDLAISTAKNLGEHPSRRLAVYDAANEEYDTARRNSDAQRAKDDAKALATLHAQKRP